MAHVPTEETRRQVKALAAYGLNAQAMCEILAITAEELARHYAQERLLGPMEAEAKVRQSLYTQAASGSVRAAKLWLEQNAGWYS